MKVSRWASDLCPPLPELLSWKDGSVPLKKIISDDVLYIMFSTPTPTPIPGDIFLRK